MTTDKEAVKETIPDCRTCGSYYGVYKHPAHGWYCSNCRVPAMADPPAPISEGETKEQWSVKTVPAGFILRGNGRALANISTLRDAEMVAAQHNSDIATLQSQNADLAKRLEEAKADIHAAKEDIHAAKEDIHAAKEDIHAAKEAFTRIRALVGATDNDPIPMSCEVYVKQELDHLKTQLSEALKQRSELEAECKAWNESTEPAHRMAAEALKECAELRKAIQPHHLCRRIATALMDEGRDWWIGELLEPVPEWPKETHCLHMKTPIKDVAFLCNRGDFEQLLVLSNVIVELENLGWLAKMTATAQKRAVSLATPTAQEKPL